MFAHFTILKLIQYFLCSDKHDVHRLKLQLHKLGTEYMYILGIPK